MKGIDASGGNAFVAPEHQYRASDIAVMWSWKQHDLIKKLQSESRPIVVMERGFIQPRNAWCSLALNGFNGLGTFPDATDSGIRWNANFADKLKPWREGGDYALVIGQVPGDQAMWGQDVSEWAQMVTDDLLAMGMKVKYRPHPQTITRCPQGAEISTDSLEQDFKGAHRVVCFSSTTAVESILEGIPTVIYHEGSIAYDMASHDVKDPLVQPDRTGWCHNMAWRQWTLDEFESGAAWQNILALIGEPK